MSYGFIKEESRAILKIVADEMIPSFGGMPSASEANVLMVYAEEVLNLRHDLRQPFFRAIRQLKELGQWSVRDRLTKLQEADEEAFDALGTVLTGGYFLNPDVRKKIGYPGQVPRVNYDPDEISDYLRNGLLEPVIRRGPIYRSV